MLFRHTMWLLLIVSAIVEEVASFSVLLAGFKLVVG